MPDQELKLLITGDASSLVGETQKSGASLKELKGETTDLNSEMGVVNVTQDDVAEALKKTGDASEETGKKVEAGGESAGRSTEKHRTLRRMMGQLDQISPGLGEALELLAHGFEGAGEGAEAGAAAVKGFNVALEEVIATLGPLIIGLLAIQAAMEYWDLYKDKVEAAAHAQEEVSKRIVDSVHKARDAVKELDAAMHPEKKDTAQQDEKNLKFQQEQLENAYTRQRDLNKAQEQKELAGAATPAEKEDISKRFELLDAQLDDWRAKQKAAIEGAMVGTMQAQLAQLQKEQDDLIKKSGPLYKMKQERGTDSDVNAYEANTKKMKDTADQAKAIREKLDDLTDQTQTDTGNAAFNSETNREKFGIAGTKYVAPKAGYDVPAPNTGLDDASHQFATGKGIADIVTKGGQASDAQQQFLVVLEQSVTGQKLTFDQAVRLMVAQSRNQEFTTTLLQNAHSRIEQVANKLRSIDAQSQNNASFNRQ